MYFKLFIILKFINDFDIEKFFIFDFIRNLQLVLDVYVDYWQKIFSDLVIV